MIPDYFDALTGYRVWNVHTNGLMVGQAFASPWKPYVAHVAECGHAESMTHIGLDGGWVDAPLWGCDCGIHALKTLERAEDRVRLEKEGRIYHSRCPETALYGRVWGELKLWGKVIVHSEGYRAQYAYPGQLYCEDPKLAKTVALLYGVPVEVKVLESSWVGVEYDWGVLPITFNFWRNSLLPSPSAPVSPAAHPILQQVSLSQIKAIGATPWQQAQAQMRAKQFPMLATDWREMWKSGLRLKKPNDPYILTGQQPALINPSQTYNAQQIVGGRRGGKTALINAVNAMVQASGRMSRGPLSTLITWVPSPGCQCPNCISARARKTP